MMDRPNLMMTQAEFRWMIELAWSSDPNWMRTGFAKLDG